MLPIRIRAFATACWLAVPTLAIATHALAQAPRPEVPKAESPGLADGLAIIASVEQATTSAIEKAEQSIVAIARVRKDQATNVRADQLLVPGQFPFADAPENPDFVRVNSLVEL